MFDWIKNWLTGNHQADFLEPETSTDTAVKFSAGEQKAKWDNALGGGIEPTTAVTTEPVVNQTGGNLAVADMLADTRLQLKALAAGVIPNAESKGAEKTLAQAYDHIIRYGDARLDQELDRWVKPDEDIHAKVFTPFSDGESAVTLVGTAHSYEVGTRMVNDVISSTQGYIDTTPPEKRMIMIEGIHGGEISAWQDLNSAVATNGEMGAAGFVAQEAGAEVVSPEAPQSEVIDKLKQAGIPADKIAAFYTLRGLPNLMRQDQLTPDKVASLVYGNSQEAGAGWVQPFSAEEMQRMVDDPNFGKTKIQPVIEAALPKLNVSLKDTITNWYQAQTAETKAKIVAGTISPKEVEQKVYRELLSVGESLAQDRNAELFRVGENGVEIGLDADTITYLTKPSSEAPETDLRVVSRIDNETRDEHLLKSIDSAVKNGKSPLVVFGGTHTIKVAPAISYMYPQSA